MGGDALGPQITPHKVRKRLVTPPKSITPGARKEQRATADGFPCLAAGLGLAASEEEPAQRSSDQDGRMAERLRLRQVGLDVDGGDASRACHDSNGLAVTRDRFVRSGVLASVGLFGGGAAALLVEPGEAEARTKRQDRRILQFLLQLEYLQAEFYSAASEGGRLRGELREFADVVGAQEQEHVSLLERRLGRSAGPRPTFDFGDALENADRFARTARQLEEMGVAAYIGQGANLTARTVATVARITSVEARHAAWIADFLGRSPAPRAADKAQTSKQVQAAIRGLGFLT